MRKELGKPTRDYFFARLAEVAPDFQRCSAYDIKGFTWSFVRRQGDLYRWLWFQGHKCRREWQKPWTSFSSAARLNIEP